MPTNKKKYEALREELESYIRTHNLKQFDKLPTVRELLKDSPYSYATLNRTLLEMERDGVITKRQGKGLFVNRVESRRKVAKQVALIIPKDFSAHKIFLDILAGVRVRLEQANISLLVSISNMSHEKEKETVAMLLTKHIDGMIISLEDHYRNDYAHIVELKERKFPFVLIDRLIPELETDYVGVNNEEAMMRLCAYLKYNRRCSSIVFVQSNDSSILASSSDEKVQGFRKAMRLLYGDVAPVKMQLEEFVASAEEISKKFDQVGVSLNHDTMIPDMFEKMREIGASLPANMHVFGYNNSYEKPVFPTVEQYNDRVGMKAAEILIRKIENPDVPLTHLRIEPRLILPDGQGNFKAEEWVEYEEGVD